MLIKELQKLSIIYLEVTKCVMSYAPDRPEEKREHAEF